MRFAYADPPYPGQAKRHYGAHPDFAGEVDHRVLVERLEGEFPDGWALSTSALALQEVLGYCPTHSAGTKRFSMDSGVRVAVWNKTNSAPTPPSRWWLNWEPVIVRGGRWRQETPTDFVRDVLSAGNSHLRSFTGAKPPSFCRWLFNLLGARPGDDLVDLFPGSGAVGSEWEAFRSQLTLDGAAA